MRCKCRLSGSRAQHVTTRLSPCPGTVPGSFVCSPTHSHFSAILWASRGWSLCTMPSGLLCSLPEGWVWPMGDWMIGREKGWDVYAHTLPILSHPHPSSSGGWVLWWQCLCGSGNIISSPCPAGPGVVTVPHCYLALDGPQSLCSGYPCSYLCKLSLSFLSCWHLFRFQIWVSALTFPSGHEPSVGITRACEFHSWSISSILFSLSIPTALSQTILLASHLASLHAGSYVSPMHLPQQSEPSLQSPDSLFYLPLQNLSMVP